MKRGLYSVFDHKAAAYNMPFVKPTPGTAERQFLDWAQEEGSSIKAHPEDYTLMYLGEWDDQTGELFPPKTGASPVCNALTLLAQSGLKVG